MRNNHLADIEHKANLILQILLYLNVYLATTWAFIYGFYIWNNLLATLDFQGKFIVLGYSVAVFAEALRLFMGYSGNLRANTGNLSIFLIMSPLIQMPNLVFLVLAVRKYKLLMSVVTYTLIVLIVSEFFVGIYLWRKHSYHQAKLYQLKLQTTLGKTKNDIIKKS